MAVKPQVYADGNVIHTAVLNNVVCIAVNPVMTTKLVRTLNTHEFLMQELQNIADDCNTASPPSYGAIRQAALNAIKSAEIE